MDHSDPGDDAGLSLHSGAPFYTTVLQPRAGVLYHFSPDRRFSPHFGIAAAATRWQAHDLTGQDDPGFFPTGTTIGGYDTDRARQTLKDTNITAVLTLGADWFVSDAVAVNLAARYHRLLGNDLDTLNPRPYGLFSHF